MNSSQANLNPAPADHNPELTEKLTSYSRCFNALAHLGRLRMFMLVCSSPTGVNVGRVSEALGLTLSGASKGLKELADCGLLVAVPIGQYVVYVPEKPRVDELVSVLKSLADAIPSKGV